MVEYSHGESPPLSGDDGRMTTDDSEPSSPDDVARRLGKLRNLDSEPLDVPWLTHPDRDRLDKALAARQVDPWDRPEGRSTDPPIASQAQDATAMAHTVDNSQDPTRIAARPGAAEHEATRVVSTDQQRRRPNRGRRGASDPPSVGSSAPPERSKRPEGRGSDEAEVAPRPAPGTALRPTLPIDPDPAVRPTRRSRNESSRPPGEPRRLPRPRIPKRPRRQPSRHRRGQSWWQRLPKLKLVVALFTIFVLGNVFWAVASYRSVERVEVADALSPSSSGFRNILLVGTDNRDGIDVDNPNADAILGEGAPSGSRTDTILLLRLGDDGSQLLSLPRDLWITQSTSGEESRINSAYAVGPDELIRTVKDNLDVPVHNYVEIDFAGFLGVVDALGGVTVDFPHAAFDTRSGLNIENPGPAKLDRDDALAYVRSRQYTEIVDGLQVRDPRGDLGRVVRQQAFLRQVFADLADVRNPVTMNRIGSNVSDNVKIDNDLSFLESLRIARKVQGLNPEPVVVPTVNHRTAGGAAVLLLDDNNAQQALDQFRDSE